MGFFDRISSGLHRSRDKFKEQMNILLDRGPDVDEEFWETLEEALILSDFGAAAADAIVEELRDEATRKALPDAYAVLDLLAEKIADQFIETDGSIFDDEAVVLFVGVNGSGKTTTVGKIAAEAHSNDRKVLLGSADTFRAAAGEQLEIWGQRIGVNTVKHQEGADPSAVIFDAVQSAKARGIDVLICDTAGRLQTKKNLMNELEKMNKVISREFPEAERETLLVLDATTGKNAVSQAKEFNEAAEITGVVLTKLDGTAKGGIAITISDEFDMPIKFIGVGEKMEDLKEFDPLEFAGGIFSE